MVYLIINYNQLAAKRGRHGKRNMTATVSPIEIFHLIIPFEIIYFVIIYIVLYYRRYIINCYSTVAELYNCPELSLSRVQIHFMILVLSLRCHASSRTQPRLFLFIIRS